MSNKEKPAVTEQGQSLYDKREERIHSESPGVAPAEATQTKEDGNAAPIVPEEPTDNGPTFEAPAKDDEVSNDAMEEPPSAGHQRDGEPRRFHEFICDNHGHKKQDIHDPKSKTPQKRADAEKEEWRIEEENEAKETAATRLAKHYTLSKKDQEILADELKEYEKKGILKPEEEDALSVSSAPGSR